MSAAQQFSLPELAPFRIEPEYVARIWGYQDLHPWFERVAEQNPIGEVWLTGDDCRVATGPHTGKKLSALFEEAHAALLGSAALPPSSPLLIKVLFAKEKLSVQVHPDDQMAQKYGQPRGKSECWYALAANPGAEVAVGLKPGITLRQVENSIHDGTLEASLNLLPVETGDTIFVDAGTVHAVWPGSVLLETQQNCDLTYRMYDYGRPRELHIERSLEATRLLTRAGKIAPREQADRTVLIDVDYFRMEHIHIAGNRTSASLLASDIGKRETGLAYLFAASGAGRLSGPGFDPVDLPPMEMVAVPAAAPEFMLENRGSLDLIRITPNWPTPHATLGPLI
jgi:mannose-6-phosphate isomerase